MRGYYMFRVPLEKRGAARLLRQQLPAPVTWLVRPLMRLLLLLLGLLRPSQSASITQGLSALGTLSPLRRVHGAALGADVVALLGLGGGLTHPLILLAGPVGARGGGRGCGGHDLVGLVSTIGIVKFK